MLRDELNEPLTGPPAPRDRGAARRTMAWAARGAAAAFAVVLAAAYEWRPVSSPVAASLPYEAIATVAPPAPPAPSPSAPATSPADPGLAIVRNGVSAATAAHQPKIIDVAEALGSRLAAAPDKRLAEPSRHGLLPRVGPDGARPSDVYARPFTPNSAMKSAPRIGVFVGGVGLEAESARSAISRLPGAVSLGLAPYGADVARVAESARAEGHEIWLQAPMESVAGPDPGPHTLKVGAGEAENFESLHWLMGRFPGYVGVAGYLGAKFTADAAAFSPVLADIGRRGLDYFDDGASPLSKATELAGGLDVKASRADLTLEPGAPTEAAFARAEDIARRQGAAILVATALPPTLEALARWTAGLAAKGFLLTPVSALTGASRERAAQARP